MPRLWREEFAEVSNDAQEYVDRLEKRNDFLVALELLGVEDWEGYREAERNAKIATKKMDKYLAQTGGKGKSW